MKSKGLVNAKVHAVFHIITKTRPSSYPAVIVIHFLCIHIYVCVCMCVGRRVYVHACVHACM